MSYAFYSLWNLKPGKVLLKPNLEQYYRYKQEDEIVLGRLPSETPKGFKEPWNSRLEKILVAVLENYQQVASI